MGNPPDSQKNSDKKEKKKSVGDIKLKPLQRLTPFGSAVEAIKAQCSKDFNHLYECALEAIYLAVENHQPAQNKLKNASSKWTHGTVRFTKGNAPTAQPPRRFVCAEVAPAPRVACHMLQDFWHIPPPNVVISVTGSAALMEGKDLNRSKVEQFVKRGVLKAAMSKGNALVVTGGFDQGVFKMVGECKDAIGQSGADVSLLGMAVWSKTKHLNDEKYRSGDKHFSVPINVAYDIRDKIKEGVCLNRGHTHFLLVGSSNSGWGEEIKPRADLEQYVAQHYKIPLVTVVIGGGEGTIVTVLESTQACVPTWLVKGSGRCADLIAEVHSILQHRKSEQDVMEAMMGKHGSDERLRLRDIFPPPKGTEPHKRNAHLKKLAAMVILCARSPFLRVFDLHLDSLQDFRRTMTSLPAYESNRFFGTGLSNIATNHPGFFHANVPLKQYDRKIATDMKGIFIDDLMEPMQVLEVMQYSKLKNPVLLVSLSSGADYDDKEASDQDDITDMVIQSLKAVRKIHDGVTANSSSGVWLVTHGRNSSTTNALADIVEEGNNDVPEIIGICNQQKIKDACLSRRSEEETKAFNNLWNEWHQKRNTDGEATMTEKVKLDDSDKEVSVWPEELPFNANHTHMIFVPPGDAKDSKGDKELMKLAEKEKKQELNAEDRDLKVCMKMRGILSKARQHSASRQWRWAFEKQVVKEHRCAWVTICFNGKVKSIDNVLNAVRSGSFLTIIEDSGGLAALLSKYIRKRNEHHSKCLALHKLGAKLFEQHVPASEKAHSTDLLRQVKEWLMAASMVTEDRSSGSENDLNSKIKDKFSVALSNFCDAENTPAQKLDATDFNKQMLNKLNQAAQKDWAKELWKDARNFFKQDRFSKHPEEASKLDDGTAGSDVKKEFNKAVQDFHEDLIEIAEDSQTEVVNFTSIKEHDVEAHKVIGQTTLRFLIESGKKEISDFFKETSLMVAACKNDINMCKDVLEGSSAEYVCRKSTHWERSGQDALHMALRRKNLDVATMIIDYMEKLNLESDKVMDIINVGTMSKQSVSLDGVTTMMLAARCGATDILSDLWELLRTSVKPHEKSSNALHCLHTTLKKVDQSGQFVLHHAVRSGNGNTVRWILSKNFDPMLKRDAARKEAEKEAEDKPGSSPKVYPAIDNQSVASRQIPAASLSGNASMTSGTGSGKGSTFQDDSTHEFKETEVNSLRKMMKTEGACIDRPENVETNGISNQYIRLRSIGAVIPEKLLDHESQIQVCDTDNSFKGARDDIHQRSDGLTTGMCSSSSLTAYELALLSWRVHWFNEDLERQSLENLKIDKKEDKEHHANLSRKVAVSKQVLDAFHEPDIDGQSCLGYNSVQSWRSKHAWMFGAPGLLSYVAYIVMVSLVCVMMTTTFSNESRLLYAHVHSVAGESFEGLGSDSDLLEWMNSGFADILWPKQGSFSQSIVQRVGKARITLNRWLPESCPDWPFDCMPSALSDNLPITSSAVADLKTNFTFTIAGQLQTVAFQSNLQDQKFEAEYMYSGGGYPIELGDSPSDQQFLQNLATNSTFIDNSTRAVRFDFTIHSPHVRRFVFCHYVIEILPSGGVKTFVRQTDFRHSTERDNYERWLFSYQVVLLGFNTFFFLGEVFDFLMKRKYKVKLSFGKQWKEYFTTDYNFFDVLNLAFFVVLAIVDTQRKEAVKQVVSSFNDDKFYDFEDAESLLLVERDLLAFYALFVWAKLLKYLIQLPIIGASLQAIIHTLIDKVVIVFLIFFLLVNTAFALAAHVGFNLNSASYSNLQASWYSMLQTLFGELQFEFVENHKGFFGPNWNYGSAGIFFLLLAMVGNMVIMNIVIPVLYSQYERARDEFSQEEWERRLTEKLSKYVFQKLLACNSGSGGHKLFAHISRFVRLLTIHNPNPDPPSEGGDYSQKLAYSDEASKFLELREMQKQLTIQDILPKLEELSQEVVLLRQKVEAKA